MSASEVRYAGAAVRPRTRVTEISCDKCQTVFAASPRYVKYRLRVKKAAKFFCSSNCAREYLKTNVTQNCVVCGKEFYCSVSQLKLRNRQTCSMVCRGASKQSKVLGGVKSRNGLKHKAQILCNKVARLRDCGGRLGSAACISCGVIFPYELLDGGHFISVIRSSTRYDLRNINAQCRHCNRYLRGDVRRYERGMLAKYGQAVVDELDERCYLSKKWTIEELEQIIKECKEQVEFYEAANV